MAGKNFGLKQGQVLFHQGDSSNGMFLIRSGELKVYLEDGESGEELALAMVHQGGMIGEMALFDHQPRSASVKATQDSEITHISNEDFAGLVKQIPKWFTALMITLSGRLRTTNARLKKLEGSGGGLSRDERIRGAVRTMGLLEVVLRVEGVKEGKGYVADFEQIIEQIYRLSADSVEDVDACFAAMKTVKLLVGKENAQKQQQLYVEDRGALKRMVSFISDFEKDSGMACLSKLGVHFLQIANSLVEQIAYDPFTLPVDNVVSEAKKRGLTGIEQVMDVLKVLGVCHKGELAIVKTSDGGVGIKGEKKALKKITKMHVRIEKFVDALGS
ncbi:MAG: cyclic nucleotide-binding domain-containing protein [Zetaproteobacteria bacterium]|nr:cyclic nucleotide-binding domain-containing protein [Zetaproteobacteria bacterium]